MASVLVVDDEEDIRELVGIYIKNEGYQVYKAANGKDALDIIDNMSIDITILDVMMADMDGITLCMEIRKKSNIPIIMLSAKDQDIDKVIGLSAGADDYLAKPFNPVELIARVKAQLRRYKDFNNQKQSNILEYLDLKKYCLHQRNLRYLSFYGRIKEMFSQRSIYMICCGVKRRHMTLIM